MSEQDMHLDQAVDNTMAKWILRILLIVLPVLISTVAGVGFWFLNQLDSSVTKLSEDSVKQQRAATERAQKQERATDEIRAEVQVMSAKIDSGVIWRITEIERRLNTVEAAQKTP